MEIYVVASDRLCGVFLSVEVAEQAQMHVAQLLRVMGGSLGRHKVRVLDVVDLVAERELV